MRFIFILFIVIWTDTNIFAQIREYWPTEGWQRKSLDEADINAAIMEEMEQSIYSSMPYVDAFLVVKNGYLVYEKYFNDGYGKNDYHIICSATKSITSILTGILLKQHYIDSLGQTVMGFFPEYSHVNDDPRLNLITLKHLLSFTTGLRNDDDMASSVKSDMIEFYLGQEFVADPGTLFRYSTPASHIQSAIVSKTTGKNARVFASEVLFSKLGISDFYWPDDDQGYTYGGHNSFFRPEDMLKIGFLYLNQGIWNGDTIVDPDYVSACTTVHSDGGSPHKEKYGYNWWITENNGYHAYFAGGYGGQFIYVVPDLDLVVAITCNTSEHREDARFLINSHVVPAILNSSVWEETRGDAIQGLIVFPNPADRNINIRFETTKDSPFTLFITDMAGRNRDRIYTNKTFPSGKYNLIYNHNLPAGCYIIRGLFNTEEYVTKMIVF
ncbi:MAG: serine hydrolase [Bacteroidales bacterium]|nr:serine hydrolase [Bacteroidales bacterium]